MIIKAITLTQPWATLVAIGAKSVETRGWRTSYRGPLAIHAAKGFPRRAKELCSREPFKSSLASVGIFEPKDFLTGVVLAVATIDRISPTDSCLVSLSEKELAFGDYSNGRFAWYLKGVRKLERPIGAKGQLSLWDWNCSAAAEVATAIAGGVR